MTKAVAKRSDASEAMFRAAAKGRALMSGTEGMRAAGQKYLPKFEAESMEAYQARLGSSWLFNGMRKTAWDMTGRVFEKPVELAEGVPEQIRTWCENVDMEGRDLSTFAREVFLDGLAGSGISYIMVDAPPREGVVSRAQAAQMNLRPYFVHLRVEDILGWRTETIGNVTRLVQLRVHEWVTEKDPEDEFATKTVPQIRVFDLIDGAVYVRLFRKREDKTGEWDVYEDSRATGMDEITVIPFYANRAGFFRGAPLLDDLADINVAHWQSQSDQRTILHFARVPILFASGRPEEDGPLVISAGMATTTTSENADLKWVEHGGQAIAAGRQDLKDLEFQMETFGLQLLAARPGAQSATGEVLDAAKETSTLAMTADQLKDALEQAIIWMGRYGGIDVSPDAGAIQINKDFGVGLMGAQELTAMLSAVNTGQISRETFLREMARRGMLRPDLDIEGELERLEDQDGELPELTARPPAPVPAEGAA